jgi:hypothetical protein
MALKLDVCRMRAEAAHANDSGTVQATFAAGLTKK